MLIGDAAGLLENQGTIQLMLDCAANGGCNATLLSGTPFFARLPNEHGPDTEALFSKFQRWSIVHLRALSSVTTKNSWLTQ